MNTAALRPVRRHSPSFSGFLSTPCDRWDWWKPDEPQLPPSEPTEFDDPSDLELPFTDDAHWDAFIADDDECDPLPEEGDFWIDDPHDVSDRFP